jgi:GxxExxY protein
MHTDAHGFIGVFYDVYNELGSGFLESVYIQALGLALDQAGFLVERETPLKVFLRGSVVGTFRADLIIGRVVLLEAKRAPDCNLYTKPRY